MVFLLLAAYLDFVFFSVLMTVRTSVVPTSQTRKPRPRGPK